jgi:D,D-heptose 1,7-bisphosphate phosphatase
VQAIVLAGGKGSRLGASPDAPPKVLSPLVGIHAIDYVLAWLGREGVTEVLLCLGHRAEEIRRAVAGERPGLRVRVLVEEAPLGTAGAVKSAEGELAKTFFVVYGDVIADVDLARMQQRHLAWGALATLAVHPNDHPYDSDRVVTHTSGRILRLARKEDRVGPEAGALASAALYVMDRELLANIPADGTPRDFARDVFPALVSRGLPLLAYRTTEYIKDMGTPERRDRVERDLLRGAPLRMRLSSHRPAVLTDRDGVLIVDREFVTRPSEIEVLPGVTSALRALNRAGMLAVCCTNQPVVARGALNEEELHGLHTLLEGKLGADGVWLDAFYACTHHPDRGFPEERPELKVACDCRKPLPGMLLRAASDLGIDRRASVFVGDRTIDLRAARAAGVLGIGVLTGTALRDGKFPIAPETPIVGAFADAVSFFLELAPSWKSRLEEIRRAGIVLVGGPSRSGKTLAASALALALSAEGTPALHVSLDRFIQPASERPHGASLETRTGLREARVAVARLVRREPTYLPSYDPLRRSSAPGEIVTWSDGVLIVEGILATTLDVPAALRVEIFAPQETLGERRRVLYAWKGLDPQQIAITLREREDEDRELAALSVAPNLIYRTDHHGRLEPFS